MRSIQNRADPKQQPRPTQTVAEIAGAVRRPSELQVAEHRLRGLRQRRTELWEQQRGLIAQHRGAGGAEAATLAREIRRLGAELSEIEAEIVEQRRALAPMRERYQADLMAALGPARRSDAEAARLALVEFRTHMARLREAAETVAAAGSLAPMAAAVPWSLPAELGPIEAALRQLEEREA
jgi:hypothetical protein